MTRMALSIAATICLGGCVTPADRMADTVAKVGAERLMQAADSLRSKVTPSNTVVLEQGLWPKAIRELQPQSVHVTEQGVFAVLTQRFVEERGVFIAFRGSNVATGPATDPSFTAVSDRVYSYRVKG